MQVDAYMVTLGITGRNPPDERCRSHNPEVAGSNPAPATNPEVLRAFFAYAHAADLRFCVQHLAHQMGFSGGFTRGLITLACGSVCSWTRGSHLD